MLAFAVNRAGSPVRREETLCFHAGTQVGSGSPFLVYHPVMARRKSVAEMDRMGTSFVSKGDVLLSGFIAAHVKFRGILQVMVIVSLSKMFFASDCWSTMCLALAMM